MAKQNIIELLDNIQSKSTFGLPTQGCRWNGSPSYRPLTVLVASNGKGGTVKVYTVDETIVDKLNSADRFLKVEDIVARARYINKDTILYVERIAMVSVYIYSRQDNIVLPAGETEIRFLAPEGVQIELQDYDDFEFGNVLEKARRKK